MRKTWFGKRPERVMDPAGGLPPAERRRNGYAPLASSPV
jgi:hypothetical protein